MYKRGKKAILPAIVLSILLLLSVVAVWLIGYTGMTITGRAISDFVIEEDMGNLSFDKSDSLLDCEILEQYYKEKGYFTESFEVGGVDVIEMYGEEVKIEVIGVEIDPEIATIKINDEQQAMVVGSGVSLDGMRGSVFVEDIYVQTVPVETGIVELSFKGFECSGTYIAGYGDYMGGVDDVSVIIENHVIPFDKEEVIDYMFEAYGSMFEEAGLETGYNGDSYYVFNNHTIGDEDYILFWTSGENIVFIAIVNWNTTILDDDEFEYLLERYFEIYPSDVDEEERPCVDSDWGMNYYVKGFVDYIDEEGVVWEPLEDKCRILVENPPSPSTAINVESCLGLNEEGFDQECEVHDFPCDLDHTCNVLEYGCDGDNLTYEVYTCPNGCIDGRCYYPGFYMEVDKKNYNENDTIINLDLVPATTLIKNITTNLYAVIDYPDTKNIWLGEFEINGSREIPISMDIFKYDNGSFYDSAYGILATCDDYDCSNGGTNSIPIYYNYEDMTVYFAFEIYDYLDFEYIITNGDGEFDILSGNGTHFTEVGKNNNIAVSDEDVMTILDTQLFVVSPNIENSYVLELLDTNEAEQEAQIKDTTTGETQTIGMNESLIIDNFTLFEIIDMNDNPESITIQALGDSAFSRMFDINGNFMDLPLEEELPTTDYTFTIYDRYGSIAQENSFYWENGQIAYGSAPEEYPDIEPNLETPYYHFLGEDILKLHIWNDGEVAARDVGYKLYISEHCDPYVAGNCDFETLGVGMVSYIGAHSNYLKEFGVGLLSDLEVNKPYILKVEVEVENDLNPKNNYDYKEFWVREDGVDLRPNIDVGNLFIDLENEITVYVENIGNKLAKSVIVTGYYAEGYCWEDFEKCNYQLMDIASLGNIGANEQKNTSFSFTPTNATYHTFYFVANASNEKYPEDNIGIVQFKVREQGPELYGYFEYRGYEEFLVGEEQTLGFRVYNHGNEDATGVEVSLYETEDYFYITKEGEEADIEKTLVDNVYIGDIGVGEVKVINLTWTPEEAGEIRVLANITADEDTDMENNYANDYYMVKREGIDIMVEGIYTGPYYTGVGMNSTIWVDVRNYGTEPAKNISVELYIDDVLFDSFVIDYLNSTSYYYQYYYYDNPISWIPLSEGNYTIRANVGVEEDVDLNNNVKEVEKKVYGVKDIRFEISNSQGNAPDKRYLYGNYFTQSYYNITGMVTNTKIIDLQEVYDSINFGLIWFEEFEEKGIVTEFKTNYTDEIEIISELYGKITQHGFNYYMVYANKLSVDVIENGLEGYMSLEYFEDLGVTLNEEDYTVYGCKDFNFNRKRCDGYWRPLKKVWIEIDEANEYRDEDMVGIHSVGGEIEAFAIGELRDFDGDSTNLSTIDNLAKIRRLILERSRYGKIRFLENADLSKYGDDAKLALEQYLKISKRKISLDTTNLPELKNLKAQLEFRNIDYKEPVVLRNGDECPDVFCEDIEYDEDEEILIVNVTGFSEYSVEEGYEEDDDTTSSGNDNDDDVRYGCKPEWDCEWGPCTNGIRRLVCVDLEDCGSSVGKPDTPSVACFILDDCEDNDHDGFGVGDSCLGPDPDDEDPTIIGPTSSQALTGTDSEPIIPYVVTLVFLGLAVLALIVLLIVAGAIKKQKRKEPSEKKNEKEKEESKSKINAVNVDKGLMNEAKKLVKQARERGYSDGDIKKMFREQGWKEDEIKALMY